MLHIESQVEPGCIEIAGGDTPRQPGWTSSPDIAHASSGDWDAANDFDVSPTAQAASQPAKAAPARPAPTPAPLQKADAPRQTILAERRAKDAEAGPLRARQAGLDKSVYGRLKSALAGDIAGLKNASAEIEALRADYRSRGLAPGAAARLIREVERSITNDTTPDDLENIQSKIARLKALVPGNAVGMRDSGIVIESSLETPSVVRAATAAVGRKLDAVAKLADAILDKCGPLMDEYLSEALKAESDFFGFHGVPVCQTAVSHRVRAAQEQIAGMRDALHRYADRHPGGNQEWTFDPVTVLGPLTC